MPRNESSEERKRRRQHEAEELRAADVQNGIVRQPRGRPRKDKDGTPMRWNQHGGGWSAASSTHISLPDFEPSLAASVIDNLWLNAAIVTHSCSLLGRHIATSTV